MMREIRTAPIIFIYPVNKQYKKLLAYDKVTIDFTDQALNKIATKALEKNIGARALRAILEDLMLDIMFELPDTSHRHYQITEELVSMAT